jgi:hypothetical protein
MKASRSNVKSKSNSNLRKGKHIIDTKPSFTNATKNVHSEEPKDPEEGEQLFHSQMLVKGTPLHFIVDNGS